MRARRLVAVTALVVVLCAASMATAVFPAPPSEVTWVEGEVLVKLAPGALVRLGSSGPATTGLPAFDEAIARHGAQAVEPALRRAPDYGRRAPGAWFRSYAGAWTEVPDLTRWYRVILPPAVDEESVARELAGLSDVDAASPNYIPHLHYMPSDEYLQYQYAVHNTGQECPAVVQGEQIMQAGLADADLDLPEAWDLVAASDTVIVSVIDTGIDYEHPDIVGNLWINTGEVPGDSLDNDGNGYIDDIYGYNFRDHHGDPWDDGGHGTHVGGTISAVGDNLIGVCGGAYNVKIMSAKFLSGGTFTDAADAITYSVDNGAHILNNSWGGPPNDLVADAMDYAVAQGAIVFASAGNSGGTGASSPACLENVLAVAATDCRDEKADFSCYGDWVELAAPGVNVLSLRADSTDMFADVGEPLVHIFPYPDGDYYLSCGTSMSCPYACATTAMVMSYYPAATNEDIIGRVVGACDPIDHLNRRYAGGLGAGRANVLNSLTATPGPRVVYISNEIDDSLGNGDGRLDPGETTDFTVRLRNMWESVESVTAGLSCQEPLVTISSSVGVFGDIATWRIASNEGTPYVVTLDESYRAGEWIEFSLAVEASAAYSETLLFWVKTHLGELPGWPVSGISPSSSPAVGDIDGDGYLDVMAAVTVSGLYAYDRFGNLLPGFPASFGSTSSGDGIAVGNIDGAGGDEVVLGTASSKLYAFDGAGNILTGWPISVGHKICSTPALYDFDGDSDLEVIAACNDAKVYVFDHEGNDVVGWPQEMDAGTGYYKVKSAPCVGDIDGQGTHVVIGAPLNGKLYAWNTDGTGYLNPDGFFAQCDTTNNRTSPIMADFDSDGRLEVFIADDCGKIYGWNDNGTLMPGWPIDAGTGGNSFYQSASVADIDGDGELELLFCSHDGSVYAWEVDGSDVEHWPVILSLGHPIISTPAIANLDGDPSPEIVICGPGSFLTALNADGSQPFGWPADVSARTGIAPIVVDLDDDGDAEVIAATYTGLHAVDTDGAVVSGPGWWTTYRYSSWRTGTLPIEESTGVSGGLADVSLRQCFPNPFNPRTTLEFHVPSAGPVRLTVYDVAGREVASLVDARMDAGRHTVTWHGLDGGGHSVASGVYFVRLEACGREKNGKLVLLR